MSQETRRQQHPGISISLQIPAKDPDLFGITATDDILSFLSRNREDAFGIRELAGETGQSRNMVSRAVDVLSTNDLVVERREKNKRLVHINRERLSVPNDPFLTIPQQEFSEPVTAAVDTLTKRLEGVVGIVLYGSVARGDADRRSDIDLWVLVEDDRATNQRRANNVRKELENRTFDGNRYGYDIDVEGVTAIPSYGSEMRKIVVEGITMYEASTFETVRSMLIHGEASDE